MEGDGMATKRKDPKHRVLRKGETFRKSDGVYVFRTVVDGKRQSIYSASLAELREKEDELFARAEHGLVIEKQKMTLNELADEYLADKEKTVQRTTIHTMYSTYNRYARKTIGEENLADLKRSTVKRFYLDLMTGSRPISLSTVSRLNSILKPMLEQAVYDDIILKNPARGVIGELKRECRDQPQKRHALETAVQDEFLDYLMSSPKHEGIRNIVIFMLGTGCRVGEAIGLRWEDISFEENMVYINHAIGYTRIDGHYRQFIKKTKTAAGDRRIPLLDEVRAALLAERKRQKKAGIVQPVLDGFTGFVFVSSRGTLYTRENISTQLKQIVSEHNEGNPKVILPEFTTHQLRHTFATYLCRHTNDIKAAQAILGHADVSTTMNVYAEAMDDGVDESMKAMKGKLFRWKGLEDIWDDQGGDPSET